MIPATRFSRRKLALFGLAGSGMATAHSLLAGGAEVLAFDDNPQRVEAAATEGIPVADLREIDWNGIHALVLSPGVPLTHPRPHWAAELAAREGVPVIGDLEIFAHEAAVGGGTTVAITGTNGKSTTTALIAHLLDYCGRDVEMGGNIGKAVLTLEPPRPGRIHVLEVSSYQIDLAPSLAPDIGILLNLTPDHLDRHGTFAQYSAVKERLVAASHTAIIAVDDDSTRAIADRLQAAGTPLTRISKDRLDSDYFAAGEMLMHAEPGQAARPLASLAGIASLRGVHNAQNALAATAACAALGLSASEIAAGLASFRGLAHRMEPIGRKGGVLFVNDSKATNVEAAALALASFPRIYWIAGGLAKEGGFELLRPSFSRIARAYLIGDAAAALAATLGDEVPFEISGTLEAAVHNAARDALFEENSESVILLSPACASFDQFRSFEHRGEAFRAAVTALDLARVTEDKD